jgi:hypothetical protein
MPSHWFGWLMLVFFSGGALGGWIVLTLWAREMIKEVWK